MLWWLIGVVVFLLLWAKLWQSQPKTAFGVLIGLLIAWVLSRFLRPYVTGMEEIPVWLPPLPFALVAGSLLIAGVLIWLRADRLAPVKREEHADHDHGHDAHGGGHGGHH
jgi:hypothetical protein